MVKSSSMTVPLTKATDVADEVRLFHITHVENLISIAAQGLLSLNELLVRGLARRNIAFQHLQERREEISVKVGAGGNLHDYVPFQFAARSPMLYTIARGGLSESVSQSSILHLYTTFKRVREAELNFGWSDGHPLSALSTFDDHPENLTAALNWEIMESQQWSNTEDDPDRKRRRQAEFLVHRALPWDCVRNIAVRDDSTKQQVELALATFSHQPKIHVIPEWYYAL